MSSVRVASRGLINRDKPLSFSFDGTSYSGFEGDTLASALLANGVTVMGRSFKYHRPRGVWGAWFDDPNAVFDVRLGDVEIPNCAAATTYLADGMHARSVNAWPNAQHDIKGGLDLFQRWLSAGFYYKTFMSPDWHFFEPSIRKMAGLGRVERNTIPEYTSDQIHDTCDVLVVGGGAAGLIAAKTAAQAGRKVWLVDDHREFGGSVYRRAVDIEGKTPSEWVLAQIQAIRAAGGRLLTQTTAYGVYDHGLVALIQDQGFGKAPRLYRMRVGQTIMATGAIDRPLTFANNDLPNIMSAQASLEFLERYGVLVGKNTLLADASNRANYVAAQIAEAGAVIQQIDLANGVLVAKGRKGIRQLRQGSNTWPVDGMLASGGWTPLVHLWRHAGGKLAWSQQHNAYLPDQAPNGMAAIGAANGTFDFEHASEEAATVGAGGTWNKKECTYIIHSQAPILGSKARQWIDFQHDVTLKDIEQAARENYTSVEHLKRYTTLGMAVDQGKTSNMAGLAAMAAIQGKSIPEVGTTTFRPPFVPVPLELYHGHKTGQLFSPLKRLALEKQLRSAGAAMGEYGGSLRPGWFGDKPPAQAVHDEVIMARSTVSLIDASPLGKIEVMGPDAEAFINFMFYNTMKTLKVGHVRYGFMLTEGGIVFDDGVVARLDPHRFVISCSSSHVEGVNLMLESWRQDGNDPDRIFVHDTTPHWATLTVSGPKARKVLETLGTDVDLRKETFPHMTLRETTWNGHPLRIARVSFTGELSYELSLSRAHVGSLWASLNTAVKAEGGGPIGIEASSIMRAEKGYIIIGKDTDGDTMPHDLGFDVPRQKKATAFVGDRSLHSEKANSDARKTLVGLHVETGASLLPTGAHIITDGDKPRSLGFVTSSYVSPTLGHPIAMAQLEAGDKMMGQAVKVRHLSTIMHATVIAPCVYDKEGTRLHA